MHTWEEDEDSSAIEGFMASSPPAWNTTIQVSPEALGIMLMGSRL